MLMLGGGTLLEEEEEGGGGQALIDLWRWVPQQSWQLPLGVEQA